METLLMMLFVGALAKGTTKAVLGGGKRSLFSATL